MTDTKPQWAVGLVLPFEEAARPGERAARIVTPDQGEFIARSDSTGVSSGFNQLVPGALATFRSDEQRGVTALGMIRQPRDAKVIGFSFRERGYLAMDRQTREFFVVKPQTPVHPSSEGGLALGASFGYLRGGDKRQPRVLHVVVQDVPRPVAIWRQMVKAVAARLLKRTALQPSV